MDFNPGQYDDSPYVKEVPTCRHQFDDASEDEQEQEQDEEEQHEDPPLPVNLLDTKRAPPPEHYQQSISSKELPQRQLLGSSITSLSASMGVASAGQPSLLSAGRKAEAIRDGDILLRHTISHIGPHDILCGPDVGIFPNAGNQFFRRLIRLKQESFRDSNTMPHVQRETVQFIYDVIRGLAPPGRFKAKGNRANGEPLWIELGDTQARNFIAASLSSGVTGLVAWQPPNFAGTRNEKKRYSASDSKVHSDSRKRRHTAPEVIQIDDDDDDHSDSSSEEENRRNHARLQLLTHSILPSSLALPHLAAVQQQLGDRRPIPESSLYPVPQSMAQYNTAWTQLHAAGGVHPALLGDDLNKLAMPRLGRVSASIPTSLLLGTPTYLGNLHHLTAGLSHGALGLMAPPTVSHQQQFQSLGSLSLREAAAGYSSAHLLAARGAPGEVDDYIRQRMDDRGG